MLTEKILKLWFKDIDQLNISILLTQYEKELVYKARLDEAKESDWNEVLYKITNYLKEYEEKNNKAEKLKIANRIIRLKVILDLIKDLDYNL